jgi:hypothetical protein
VTAAAIGRAAFERQIAGEVDQLLTAASGADASVVTEADLEPLPAPVQRWLRWSQVVGRERAVTVRLRGEGDFRLGDDRGWIPFRAEQHFTTDPPGFLWQASMRMAPLLSVAGRDRYAGGRADIEMRVLSLVPVARSSGPGLDQGALGRYLGEIVWLPSAALSPLLRWEEIDESSARATISYGGATASGVFAFDAVGRPTEFRGVRWADARGRQEEFSVPLHAYGELDGIRIPTAGDGAWHYDSGDFTFIRWRITRAGYNR